MTTLTGDQIDEWRRTHAEWRVEDEALTRAVECRSFPAAIDLVRRVAEIAEERDHHPDIDIRWRTLRFALSTHSEGGITVKDTALAEAIDELAGDQAG